MVTGELMQSRSRFSLPPLAGVPVLLYHGIYKEAGIPDETAKYQLSLDLFRAHLATISTARIRVGLLSDLTVDIAAAGGAPEAILTFDDGWASDYRFVFPALQAASLRAEFFVNTGLLDQPGYLCWKEVIEMDRAGMSFQSHGHDHVDLSRLSQRQVREQLARSKSLLQDRLGAEVTALAVPYGLLGRQLVDIAEIVGYQTICCSRCWPAAPGARIVNRVAIYRNATTKHLRHILAKNPLWFWRRRVRSSVIYLPKRVALGRWPSFLGVRTLQGH